MAQRSGGRPTIAEVAAASGVSKATVSKALSMPPGACPISAETRDLVLRTARRLGYRPDWLASALSRGRTGTVALLYARPVPPTTGQNFEIIQGLQEALERADLDLVMQRVEDGSGRAFELIERSRYDGVVVFEHLPDRLRDLLLPGRLPWVLMNAAGPPEAPSVRPDDPAAARLALRHLAGLGHRDLLFWHGEFHDAHYSAGVRATTFCAFAAAAGLRAEERIASADDLARAIAGGTVRATAVVAFHEILAARLLQACWRHGVAVPGRLSVLTFNDSYIGRLTIPALTAVAMPALELGSRTAALLLARMAGGRGIPQLVPVTAVAERGSTGPPPG